jgi:hypothetical protein
VHKPSHINERIPTKAGHLELTSRGMIEHLGDGKTRPYVKS